MRVKLFSCLLVWAFFQLWFIAPPGAHAEGPVKSVVVVTVRNAAGQPVEGVELNVVGHPYRARSDHQGQARFVGLAPGHYLVRATSSLGVASQEITVTEGEQQVDVVLRSATFHEEVVVSAAHPQRLSETAQPVSVVAEDELLLSAQTSLGETLRAQPGVATTFYSPGASRPLLRGQGGDRVRILQSGLDLGDASDTSPDHGVALSPATLDRVEILRGPAALLYGTETLGGVINAMGGPVPQAPQTTPLAGALSLALSSNGEQRWATTTLEGQQGPWTWHAAGAKNRSDDYRSAWGTVTNSFTEGNDASFGLTRFFGVSYLGLGFERHESSYGSPVEEEVHVELFRQRWELRGEVPFTRGPLTRLRFGLSQVDYHHLEFEGEQPGTRIDNTLLTSRLELHHQAGLGVSGIFGVEGSRREFGTKGEEAYLPVTDTSKVALFFWEHGDRGPFHLEVGGRLDRTRHEASGTNPSRAFDFASLTVSGTWGPRAHLKLYAALGSAGKAPNPEELYSNGPHAATGLFEVGDPHLHVERSHHLELGARWTMAKGTLQFNVFRAEVDNFTFQTLSDEEEDGLPVAFFRQADARFWGAELSGHWDLLNGEDHRLELSYGGDLVRGELTRGENLPRIPPARLFAQAQWQASPWTLRFGVQKVLKADRIAREETVTPGYTLLDTAVGYRLFQERTLHILWLSATNLTDTKALNHTSFFKEKSPLPGRNVSLRYQLVF